MLVTRILETRLLTYILIMHACSQRELYRTVTKIPGHLAGVMDQETFEKARLYNLDKSNFGFWVGIWGEIEHSVRNIILRLQFCFD